MKEIIARGLFAKFSQYLSLLSPRPFGFQAEGILHAIGDLTGLESMQPGIRTTQDLNVAKSSGPAMWLTNFFHPVSLYRNRARILRGRVLTWGIYCIKVFIYVDDYGWDNHGAKIWAGGKFVRNFEHPVDLGSFHFRSLIFACATISRKSVRRT